MFYISPPPIRNLCNSNALRVGNNYLEDTAECKDKHSKTKINTQAENCLRDSKYATSVVF